jgi:hypothetical protein
MWSATNGYSCLKFNIIPIKYPVISSAQQIKPINPIYSRLDDSRNSDVQYFRIRRHSLAKSELSKVWSNFCWINLANLHYVCFEVIYCGGQKKQSEHLAVSQRPSTTQESLLKPQNAWLFQSHLFDLDFVFRHLLVHNVRYSV